MRVSLPELGCLLVFGLVLALAPFRVTIINNNYNRSNCECENGGKQ